MGQILTLELNEEVYAVIQRQAAAAGTSPAHWIASMLEQQCEHLRDWQVDRARRTEAEKQVPRERFEQHFGEVDLGYATGADNEQIDLDLAREYADPHEDTDVPRYLKLCLNASAQHNGGVDNRSPF